MKPKEWQVEFLANCGITPPKTEPVCRRLINFLKYGNRLATGKNLKERITEYKAIEERWVGKRVKQRNGSKTGTVVSLLTRSINAIAAKLRSAQLNRDLAWTSPFEAIVHWDDEKNAVSRSFYGILLIEDEPVENSA